MSIVSQQNVKVYLEIYLNNTMQIKKWSNELRPNTTEIPNLNGKEIQISNRNMNLHRNIIHYYYNNPWKIKEIMFFLSYYMIDFDTI